MLNIELLRDAVTWVEWQATLNPEKRTWEQDVWWVDLDEARGVKNSYDWLVKVKTDCGTACCFAGYVAETAYGSEKIRELDSGFTDQAQVFDLSCEALGILDNDEALKVYDDLTGARNDPAEIRELAGKLAACYGMEL
jgi:hypothetical protein